jgi:phosphatidylserine/phosphatidylglycerophosphate/cardiolipin synthase-like enzyme
LALLIITEKWQLLKAMRRKQMNNSSLFNEKTFYNRFIADLFYCETEVIIESPFISRSRMLKLFPIFEDLIKRNIQITVITRDPNEHTEPYNLQSEEVIQYFEQIGIRTLLCVGNHHRKLAIVDRRILWEGSLNILSQTRSREIMRRIESKELTEEMFSFLNFDTIL